MGELKMKAEVVGLRYYCDECGEEMSSEDYIYPTSPPMYPHTCPKGHRVNLSRAYPSYDILITSDEL